MGSSQSCRENGKTAMCRIHNEKIKGVITFHQCSPQHPVVVHFDIKGKPDSVNAIHIHQYGNSKNGLCKELGPHFNPYNEMHGSIHYNEPRHVGDLINNIHFDGDGNFNYTYQDPLINL